MEEIYISKLSEFMDYVEKLPQEFTLSRGQSNLKYKLLPGALRRDESGNMKYTRQSIANFLKEFKINSHNYMDKPWDVKNDYEWMIHAQHYGIPTRLLDFTSSHIISLMFSVQSAFNNNDDIDGVVWFIDPLKLNNSSCCRSQIIALSEKESISLDDCNGPIVVQGRKLNDRINAQNGVFIYFQDKSEALNDLIKDECILRKVVIKGTSKKDILVSLYSMGIGMTQIYPELNSVAEDILMRDNIKQYLMGE
ncbi:FRG domain-containing protein [Clostridium intestinale]|uniref:FRG domain-containing protein n=1 Tax=Clostridium intestinale TaxID=36845 RepID=UPI002DD63C50|nr:FRG domain-containing protein [Clostridium intestinale]WRY49661.1 FRG domain-containing protein [Clostridium intestinale]